MNRTGQRLRTVIPFIFLLLFGFLAPVAANPIPGIPVLLYHHVNDQETGSKHLTISTIEFKRQLRLLRTHGFQSITLAQLGAFMRGEQVFLPDRPILITFDDGHADNFDQAFPILKEFGYNATIFMVGINFDRVNRLSSSQIREMIARNLSVGAHSMTHPNLSNLGSSELRHEVTGSKKKAERALRADVSYFAYPGGFYNLATLEAVEAAGFLGAFSVLPGLNRPERENIFLLRRIPVFSYTDFDHLVEKLNQPPTSPSLLDY